MSLQDTCTDRWPYILRVSKTPIKTYNLVEDVYAVLTRQVPEIACCSVRATVPDRSSVAAEARTNRFGVWGVHEADGQAG